MLQTARQVSGWLYTQRGSQHAAEVADVLDEPVRALEPREGVGEVAVLRVGAHLAGARAAGAVEIVWDSALQGLSGNGCDMLGAVSANLQWWIPNC